METINKIHETKYHIISSDSTYQQVREKALVRQPDSVTVRGKTKPVLIYESLGMDSGSLRSPGPPAMPVERPAAKGRNHEI